MGDKIAAIVPGNSADYPGRWLLSFSSTVTTDCLLVKGERP